MPYRNLAAMGTVRTNNGTESLNNVIKNRVMNGKGGQISLPQLMSSLVYDFLPGRLLTYKQRVSTMLNLRPRPNPLAPSLLLDFTMFVNPGLVIMNILSIWDTCHRGIDVFLLLYFFRSQLTPATTSRL